MLGARVGVQGVVKVSLSGVFVMKQFATLLLVDVEHRLNSMLFLLVVVEHENKI
jgi:hypothetical protein